MEEEKKKETSCRVQEKHRMYACSLSFSILHGYECIREQYEHRIHYTLLLQS